MTLASIYFVQLLIEVWHQKECPPISWTPETRFTTPNPCISARYLRGAFIVDIHSISWCGRWIRIRALRPNSAWSLEEKGEERWNVCWLHLTKHGMQLVEKPLFYLLKQRSIFPPQSNEMNKLTNQLPNFQCNTSTKLLSKTQYIIQQEDTKCRGQDFNSLPLMNAQNETKN